MKPPRYFTPTFKKFFIGFLCIVGVAFAVLLIATQYVPPQAVDTFAAPR